MAEFIQTGKALDYPNASGVAIAYGDVVVSGNKVFVAAADIANGTTGAVSAEGVFSFPADTSLAITIGDNVYYHTTTLSINKTSTNGVLAGFATCAKTSNGTSVDVKIG